MGGPKFDGRSSLSPLTPDSPRMIYWVHIARAIDRVTLHRDRCSEVPSTATSSDFWEGGWFDYPDKERALRAMEQAGVTRQRMCTLCKP
ncbi:MAG: hypothetical protein KF876_03300 [Nitrospira sp.]|nr:hypothetical protein [Nitrospira sp.]MDR4468198.1 hypothetical protein [Nitrospira sp.]